MSPIESAARDYIAAIASDDAGVAVCDAAYAKLRDAVTSSPVRSRILLPVTADGKTYLQCLDPSAVTYIGEMAACITLVVVNGKSFQCDGSILEVAQKLGWDDATAQIKQYDEKYNFKGMN